MRRAMAAAVIVATAATTAVAEDRALIVANGEYEFHRNVLGLSALTDLAPRLRELGFEVEVARNTGRDRLAGLMAELRTDLGTTDRVLVVLAGHFAASTRDGWLLTGAADAPGAFEVGAVGLPVGPVLDLVAERPGAAVVALAAPSLELELGAGLTSGYVPARVPQGVTVLTGRPPPMARLLREGLLAPGRSVAEALDGGDGKVTGHGYLPAGTAFLPAGRDGDGGAPQIEVQRSGEDAAALARAVERAFWQRTAEADTAVAYRSFLERFPDSSFAGQARARLDALEETPEERAARIEREIGLTREARQQIQRNLSILGFDTRGIDGIFGEGTRAAIRGWQDQAGVSTSGYLTQRQITRLSDAAAARARQLEAEAEARQAERDRRDRAFWQETAEPGGAAELTAYLERFPDGLFAGEARQRLRALTQDRRAEVAAAERQAWDDAVATDTPAAYRRYLDRYPEGAFAETARGRLQRFANQGAGEAATAEARAEEGALTGNQVTRLLVERRLAELGLDPGAPDGQFDQATRRALRRFQRARELPPTGYVSRATAVQLLVSIGGG